MNSSNVSADIILASGSAIRRQILDGAGLEYRVKTSAVDEAIIKSAMLAQSAPPEDIALALAKAKALNVSTLEPQALVIGADQVMVMDGRLYDKPADMDEAAARLWDMRGKTHYLIGAVTIAKDEQIIWQHMSETALTVREFSRSFLDEYLKAEGEGILSSVGAYKFEGRGAQLFESVDGDFFSILGLSLLPVLEVLRQRGVITA